MKNRGIQWIEIIREVGLKEKLQLLPDSHNVSFMSRSGKTFHSHGNCLKKWLLIDLLDEYADFNLL